MRVTIHRATADEVADIKQVLSTTWADTYSGFLSPQTIEMVTTVWHNPEQLKREIEHPNVYTAVAKTESGQIVGMISAGSRDPIILQVSRLYILPNFQRRGIGGLLMSSAVDAYPNAQKLRLGVDAQNKKGLSFYVKQGFVEVGRQTESIRSQDREETLEEIIMEKPLP